MAVIERIVVVACDGPGCEARIEVRPAMEPGPWRFSGDTTVEAIWQAGWFVGNGYAFGKPGAHYCGSGCIRAADRARQSGIPDGEEGR